MGMAANNVRSLLKYVRLNPSAGKPPEKKSLSPEPELKLNETRNRDPEQLLNDLDLNASINRAMHLFDDK